MVTIPFKFTRETLNLWKNLLPTRIACIPCPYYSQIMCYLVQLPSINTDLPFKSSILKLILADDFVFTGGFLTFLSFLISSSLVFNTFLKKIF